MRSNNKTNQPYCNRKREAVIVLIYAHGRTHCDETVAHGQVIRFTNRPVELPKEAHLQELNTNKLDSIKQK